MLVYGALALFGLLLVVGAVVLVHLMAASRNAVGPVMTPTGALAEIVAALELPERGLVWDLGCGDGGMMAAIGAARPGLRLVGVENNPVLWVLARWRLRRGRARVVLGDILAQDVRGADRVFVYLGPGLMKALEPKFERQLAAGSRVVSLQFPLPTRAADSEITLEHGKPHAAKIYIYKY